MEYSFQGAEHSQPPQEQPSDTSAMSMLAMASPTPHTLFQRDYAWHSPRPVESASSRPRTTGEPERIALPSIRQAFPELHLRVAPPESSVKPPSTTTSPIVGPPNTFTPPEYVHSPTSNKRRRLSFGQESDGRAAQVPRLYANAVAPSQRPTGRTPPPLLARPMTEYWAASSSGHPSMNRHVPVASPERAEARPSLPAAPLPGMDRESLPMARIPVHSNDEYSVPTSRPMHVQRSPIMEPGPPVYRQGGYAYGFHHPSRAQSLSLGSIRPFEGSPFSSAAYPHYQDYVRMGDYGTMSLNGDSKQRKRRGNLPKETTDKLRAWFVSHLHHPYPTEDEKQELMRQTGLQMNQISNWFINARRRQLPTMINNARAESDALSSARGLDGKVLPSTEGAEYEGKRGSPISESDSHNFEDEFDELKRRRANHMKRGSV